MCTLDLEWMPEMTLLILERLNQISPPTCSFITIYLFGMRCVDEH